MTATLAPQIRFQPLNAGAPIPGGTVLFYQAGTTTPQNVYAADGVTSIGNTLTLDANGATDFRLGTGLSYKILLKDAAGVTVTGWPIDNITGTDGVLIALASTSSGQGDALIGVKSDLTGAVARTQHLKNAEFVSVLDFGADKTGVADSTTAIQAALDSGAKRIYAPAGTYNITKLLFRGNGIEFWGDGDQTILNCTSTTVFAAICIVESYTFFNIHDFRLQGAITSEPAGPAPLRGIVDGTNTAGTAHSVLTYAANNRISRVHITGATPGTNGFNVGIQFNLASYSTVQDCVIESIYGTSASFGYGIVCNGTGQQVVNNRILSTITGQGRHAVYLTDTSTSNKVIGNYCSGFQNEGITSNTSSTNYDLLIMGNTLINCLASASGTTASVICVLTAPYSKIIGNTIKTSNSHGICAVAGSTGAIIEGNTIESPKLQGVYISSSDYVRVVNNTIVNPDSSGTSTYGGVEIITSNKVFVGGNSISGTNYRFGVRFNATPTFPANCQVYDNIIQGTYTYDIENPSQDTSCSVRRPINEPRVVAYTPGATTVDVSQNVRIITNVNNASATTITNFLNGYTGQIITLYFPDVNTTINRSNCLLAGGVNFVSTVSSTLTLLKTATNWYEIGRTTSIG